MSGTARELISETEFLRVARAVGTQAVVHTKASARYWHQHLSAGIFLCDSTFSCHLPTDGVFVPFLDFAKSPSSHVMMEERRIALQAGHAYAQEYEWTIIAERCSVCDRCFVADGNKRLVALVRSGDRRWRDTPLDVWEVAFPHSGTSHPNMRHICLC
jgi:hypothetical protein